MERDSVSVPKACIYHFSAGGGGGIKVINLICLESNCIDEIYKKITYESELVLIDQPDKPQNLNCETEDMINIRCTWNPVYVPTDCFFREACPMEFFLSDV